MPRRNDAEVSQEVEKVPEFFRNIDHQRMRDDEVASVMEAGFAKVAEASTDFAEIDGSVPVLSDLTELVGKPFATLEWRFNDGDYGPFVSALIMTEDNKLHIINDGGTGIYRQFEKLTDERPSQRGPIVHWNGVTKSSYYYNQDTGQTSKKLPADGGNWIPSATFYLT